MNRNMQTLYRAMLISKHKAHTECEGECYIIITNSPLHHFFDNEFKVYVKTGWA